MGGGPQGMGGLGGLGGPVMGMGIPPPETQQMQHREQLWGMWWKALLVLSSFYSVGWVLQGTGWSFAGSALERVESANMAREEAPVFMTLFYFAFSSVR